MSAQYINRLTTLLMFLAQLPDENYNHGCYSTCAIGVVCANLESFPEWEMFLINDRLYDVNTKEYIFGDTPKYVDRYFGAGAWNNIFAYWVSSSGSLAGREDTINNIQLFIKQMKF